eukprot:s615_g7.t2
MPIPEEESSSGRFLDRAPLPFGTSSATTPTVMATTHDDQGFLGAAVGQPGCTGCFICGAKDHDFRTCPRRSQKGGKGKGTGIHYAEASVFTVTMEDEPGDEVIPAFKSQGIVAGADLDGYAVLGTGATETVGSLPAIEQLMKVRYQQRGYPESVHVMDQPPKKFKSGNGETAFSSSYILLPQQLGDQEVHLGIYTLDVVGVPVLVGIKTLHRLGAVLGLAKFVVVFTSVDMARAIKLQRSPSGHALLDLRGDWLSGGCLVSELGKTLQPVLFSEEKGAESAYMVTESGTVPDHEVPCPVPDGSDRQCSCACVSYQSQTTGAPNDVDGQNVGSSNVSKPMRSLVTLLTLVALHGGPLEEGASFDCQGQGQEQTKDGTAASRLRPDGGRGPSRPTGSRGSLQGQPLPKDSVQPVCTVDRLLAPDTKEMIKNVPEDTESYPTNREIRLPAAENSTLRQLERVRRLRDGVATTSTKAPATTEKIKNTAEEVDQKKMKAKTKAAAVSVDDDSELEEQSSLSPNTILVPGGSEELPAHPGRKASRPSETIPEQLEYQNRSRTTMGDLVHDDFQHGIAGVPEPILNNHGGLCYVRLDNYQHIEEVCGQFLMSKDFSHEALEYVVMNLTTKAQGSSRGIWSAADNTSVSLTFGLYARGNQYGVTRATVEYPALCRYVNQCVATWFPGDSRRWTSVSVLVNVRSKLHRDNHNYHDSENLSCSYGNYTGGELWLEATEQGRSTTPQLLKYRDLPNGERAYHGPMPWKGQRGSVTAFTARTITSVDDEVKNELRKFDFPVPLKTNLTFPNEVNGVEEVNVESADPEILREEDKAMILHQINEAQEALNEIFSVYPSEPRLQVVTVCNAWFEPVILGEELMEHGINHFNLGFAEGCDLTTNFGYQMPNLLPKDQSGCGAMFPETSRTFPWSAQRTEGDLQGQETPEGCAKRFARHINLEWTDKLWECLQVDGFDTRVGSQVHHFVLMVDEASGYAVIREAFRHHEDEGRNLTGDELIAILREAWFAYFGYPSVLKLDLEGAHRSKKLSEECMANGLEIVAAPAEHHQTISEV